MAGSRRFVVVGASLAGAKAAQTLRKAGYEGAITLVGEEPVRPYERPPLSKEYLRGEAGRDQLFVHGEGFYRAADIELRVSERVTAVDVDARTVTLGPEERLAYDSLLLCTGARPRRLALPGGDLEGVHYLRDLTSADGLRAAIKSAAQVVVIGAGWIGCEVAASARQSGAHVAMVEVAEYPLQKVLGRELGQFYRAVHADHGVEMHFNARPEALLGSVTVEGLRLADGRTLAADVVVVGTGAEPRASSWLSTPGSRRATACSPTSTSRPPSRAFLPPATWPIRSTHCSGSTCG